MNNMRKRIYEIIFEADTRMGKAFDVLLLVAILASGVVVMLDSVEEISEGYSGILLGLEWFFTILFTVEYALRLYCVRRPWRYATSFFGIVDLISIVPTYLSIFFVGAQHLQVIRILRLLRIFRIFKLVRYLTEAASLRQAMAASIPKVSVFLGTVVTVVVIVGALMYLIEGPGEPFSSIPKSMYWAIVTLTTVGYGDITPVTVLGKTLASMLMIAGYGLIAVPTGIVTAELMHIGKPLSPSTQCCPHCLGEGHSMDAIHCKFCGTKLNEDKTT